MYRSLDGDYGLQALEEIFSDLLPLYGDVCLLGDFNVDLLDPGHSLFPRFLDFLEMFMLCNVAIFPTREASGKLLNLFLVPNPCDVGDFHQIAVPWSDHDMIFLSCCFEKSRVATLYKSMRSFRVIDRDGLLRASLDWSAVWFMAGVNEKVESFYTMLNFLLDTFERLCLCVGSGLPKGTDYAAFAIGLTRVWSLRSTRGMLLIRFGMTILTG
jgi:hypothetical protein